MTNSSWVIRLFLGLAILCVSQMSFSLIIDNGLVSNQGGYFSVDVKTAGETSDVYITDPSATRQNEEIVYAYESYVVVNGSSLRLS